MGEWRWEPAAAASDVSARVGAIDALDALRRKADGLVIAPLPVAQSVKVADVDAPGRGGVPVIEVPLIAGTSLATGRALNVAPTDVFDMTTGLPLPTTRDAAFIAKGARKECNHGMINFSFSSGVDSMRSGGAEKRHFCRMPFCARWNWI